MVTFHSPCIGRAIACVLCAGGLLVLVGCGGTEKLVKVTGRVTHQGKPYPQAPLWVLAESPSGGKPVQALVDQNGVFSLATEGAGEGVVPGRYKMGLRFSVKGRQPPPALKKYASSETTPLTVDVPPEGLTDYDVKLD